MNFIICISVGYNWSDFITYKIDDPGRHSNHGIDIGQAIARSISHLLPHLSAPLEYLPPADPTMTQGELLDFKSASVDKCTQPPLQNGSSGAGDGGTVNRHPCRPRLRTRTFQCGFLLPLQARGKNQARHYCRVFKVKPVESDAFVLRVFGDMHFQRGPCK